MRDDDHCARNSIWRHLAGGKCGAKEMRNSLLISDTTAGDTMYKYRIWLFFLKWMVPLLYIIWLSLVGPSTNFGNWLIIYIFDFTCIRIEIGFIGAVVVNNSTNNMQDLWDPESKHCDVKPLRPAPLVVIGMIPWPWALIHGSPSRSMAQNLGVMQVQKIDPLKGSWIQLKAEKLDSISKKQYVQLSLQ